ncbi:MAG TPA: HD-GYP domain-containing protein, partial [Acidimicrobiales bacterium]|nr:HD-GYP domain-containing protein [Acidimicrobiales bacterium]
KSTGADRRAGTDETPSGVWSSRPVLARLVHLAVLVIPIASSVAVGAVVDRLLPFGDGWSLGLRWITTLGASTVVLVVVGRLTRRLLPLAVLLKLSLVFPDRTPARFAVALRAGATRRVNRALTEAAESADAGSTPTETITRVLVLLGALAAHDPRTRGHSERVRALNDLVAEEIGLTSTDRDRLRWAALLHDIGKLYIHPKILNKPGPLDAAQWRAMKTHPELGARIVAPLRDWLGDWADAIGDHHERFDGGGYPKGLAGTDISLGGRIVAVVDAFEVMTAVRPYKRPVSPEAARKELVSCAGTCFDPNVVRAMLSVSIGTLRRVLGPWSWLAQLPFLRGVPHLEGVAAATTRQIVASTGTLATTGVVAVGAVTTTGALSSVLAAPQAATAPPLAAPSTGGSPLKGQQAGSESAPSSKAPGVSDNAGTAGPPDVSGSSGIEPAASGNTSGHIDSTSVSPSRTASGSESSQATTRSGQSASGTSGSSGGDSGSSGGSTGSPGSSSGSSGSSSGTSGTSGSSGGSSGTSEGSTGSSGKSGLVGGLLKGVGSLLGGLLG